MEVTKLKASPVPPAEPTQTHYPRATINSSIYMMRKFTEVTISRFQIQIKQAGYGICISPFQISHVF
jgi:hypothetical protein